VISLIAANPKHPPGPPMTLGKAEQATSAAYS
jgi:hypothetical protein